MTPYQYHKKIWVIDNSILSDKLRQYIDNKFSSILILEEDKDRPWFPILIKFEVWGWDDGGDGDDLCSERNTCYFATFEYCDKLQYILDAFNQILNETNWLGKNIDHISDIKIYKDS